VSPRIRILPETLTNKIAAGEVVERPASVVKELVENALDAGCGDLVVEIEQGGRKLIKVSDDGCGMSREDALLALERHATSKISTDADLFGLSTLGFRGEALPSIASVSRFTLATRESAQIEGTEIYAEGGRIKEVKSCGMAVGTVITVRNLFFNTPARLKFMKSSETEAGHVGDLLARLAISRPQTRFTYSADGRTVFRLLPGDLHQRVTSLLGGTIGKALYPIDFVDGPLSVSGLVASPDCNRSAASHLYTFINGRFIRDKVVQHAILQSYRNFLERGRYPVVVLFIGLPPGEVDVNVHPTKHEVRFREQARVHDGIVAAVESVLRATPWLGKGCATVSAFTSASPDSSPTSMRVDAVREALSRYQPSSPRQGSFPVPPPVQSGGRDILSRPLAGVPDIIDRQTASSAPGFFSSLAVIGQYHGSYIVCQDENDLVLIDQHAAHERVVFERLKAQFAADGIESQGLLFTETLEFSFREGAVLSENRADLARLGYEIEEFGGATWLLKGVPRLLTGGNYQRTLRDIVEELQGLGKSRSFADALEAILARIACHSVVRGVHSLGRDEIVALFAQMDATDFSSNCPHGRPVSRTLTFAEIERLFKRG